MTGKFFAKGGIQRGCPLLASGGVAVEQKSNVSAISCPTSNIACRNRHTYRKWRKIVRQKIAKNIRAIAQKLTNIFAESQKRIQKIKNVGAKNMTGKALNKNWYRTNQKMKFSRRKLYFFVATIVIARKFILISKKLV